jgi:hypothetical protein
LQQKNPLKLFLFPVIIFRIVFNIEIAKVLCCSESILNINLHLFMKASINIGGRLINYFWAIGRGQKDPLLFIIMDTCYVEINYVTCLMMMTCEQVVL